MLPLDNQDMVALIKNGLTPTPHPKRVIVIGAGMAGLTAAYELQRAGHDVIVLEAQQRVGGRVYTMREPFTHGLYAEVGAMRLPRTHHLTMAYIDKFKIKTSAFTMGNPKAYYYLNGRMPMPIPTRSALISRRKSAARPPINSGRRRSCRS